MELYDPDRPTINHKLAFASGHQHIPQLNLWPLPSGQIELSMMLPLSDDRFAGKYFSCKINVVDLPTTILTFVNDPEKFVADYLDNDPHGLRPAIWGQKPPEKITKPSQDLTELMILEEE